MSSKPEIEESLTEVCKTICKILLEILDTLREMKGGPWTEGQFEEEEEVKDGEEEQ